MKERNESLARALGYPYAIPAASYMLAEGGVADLDMADVDRSDRIALLAYGSNAAPEILAAKLDGTPDSVPVIRTALRDFDVVYSAHISRYGSVPATLRRSPGTEAAAFLAFLTPEQLRLVSATEPNYELVRFDRPSCTLESGSAPSELWAYLSRHGCLLLDGHEVALAEIEARHRRFPALAQRQVLERVRDALAPGRDLPSFVESSLAGEISYAGLSSGEAP